MRARYRVALQGFNATERGALALCLHYTAGREIGYEEVADATHADFLIADAGADDIAGQLRAGGRLRDTVFVGEPAVPGALSQVPRPIDPDAVVQELDELLALRRAEASGLTVEVGLPLDERMPAFETEPVAPRAGPSSVERAATLATNDGAARATPPTAQAEPAARAAARSAPTARPAPELRTPTDPAEAKAAARRAARLARLRDNPLPAGAEVATDVLVLDDSEIARLHLCRLLGDFGFRAHPVADSAAASALLTAQPFALAIIDIVLDAADAVDGLELCQRLKLSPPLAPAPQVLLVTGSARPTDEVRARLAGCDAFLAKPITRGGLARALESCRVALPADARRV